MKNCLHYYYFKISYAPSILRRLLNSQLDSTSWRPIHSIRSISTYQQITKIVRRMKASSSPCPLDKISSIPFNRFPYLRSYITELFRIIWQFCEVPVDWKKACTVLSHKKAIPQTLLILGLLLLKCSA